LDRSKARPFIHFYVALDRYPTKMVIVFVCASGHVSAAAQRVIGDNLRDPGVRGLRYTDRAKGARRSSKRLANLIRMRGSNVDRAARIVELGLVQP
jgi:hypothetical protein